MLKFLLRNSPCFIGVAKGEPDLLARVNTILTAARQDGRLDRISAESWLWACRSATRNTPISAPARK